MKTNSKLNDVRTGKPNKIFNKIKRNNYTKPKMEIKNNYKSLINKIKAGLMLIMKNIKHFYFLFCVEVQQEEEAQN